MPRKSNVPLRKMNMNLPVPLIERIDEYAVSIGLNRSSTIIMLLTTRLEQLEQMSITQNANTNLQQFLSNPQLMAEMLKSKQVNG